jgi:hypothetical protein
VSALVSAFCALASLESMLAPHMGVGGSGGDMVIAWLGRLDVSVDAGKRRAVMEIPL